MSADEQLDPTARAIVAECGALADLLIEKNRKYGNSALIPLRLFSRADAVEQLRVRIDDKLSRINSAQADDAEDVELDLLGYLVLLRIARKAASATDKDCLQVAAAENSYLDKLRALRHGREGSSGYVVPPVDDSDDDPAVVHVVPDRSSRATLTTDTALPFDNDKEELSVEDQERIYRVPDRTSRATLPDECLGALCGRQSSEYLAAQLRGATDGY